jgi:AcrR family transcriptional regulator
MPRPSRNSDLRLIRAARELLETSALSRMKLRQVAARAGVNLGMFHYHFRTKEQFTRAVLQDSYERFFRKFTLETAKEGPPLERLRAALVTLGRFVAANRRMLLGLLHDLLNQNRMVLDFIRANGPRHGRVIVGLVRQCQRAGSLRRGALVALMPVLMGACLFPLIMVALLEHLEIKRLSFIPLPVVRAAVASDRAIRARVDLVLESLGPGKGGRK